MAAGASACQENGGPPHEPLISLTTQGARAIIPFPFEDVSSNCE